MIGKGLALGFGLLLAGLACLAQAQSPFLQSQFPPGVYSNKTALDAPIGIATTTFDPAKKGPDITLSGANLIAIKTSFGFNTVLSIATCGASTYFEMTVTVFDTVASSIGFSLSTFSLTGFMGDTGSYGYVGTGDVRINGSTVNTIAPYTTSNVVGVAFNTSSNKAWARVNAGGWNNDVIANQNPATGTGGDSIASITGPFNIGLTLFNNGAQYSANFGGSAYANTAPAGYGNCI